MNFGLKENVNSRRLMMPVEYPFPSPGARIIFLFFLWFWMNACSENKGVQNESIKEYQSVEKSEIPWTVWDKSVEDRNIHLLELGQGENVVVIFGAFHGDEPLGSLLVLKFAEYLFRQFDGEMKSKVIIVPVVNPDGLFQGTRTNHNGVDINRNFPTKNWSEDSKSKRYFPGKEPGSEPETRAVIRLLEEFHPDRIVSVHTPLKMVNYDGPGLELARKMAGFNKYPVQDDVGYETPGSFGNYAGVERNISVITLELPQIPLEEVWEQNRDALLAAIRFDDIPQH